MGMWDSGEYRKNYTAVLTNVYRRICWFTECIQ